MGQVVLAANVADLLGLHGLEFGAVGDPMAQAPAEGTATLSWAHGVWGEEVSMVTGPGSTPQTLVPPNPPSPLMGRVDLVFPSCPPWTSVPRSAVTSNVQHGLIPAVQHL